MKMYKVFLGMVICIILLIVLLVGVSQYKDSRSSNVSPTQPLPQISVTSTPDIANQKVADFLTKEEIKVLKDNGINIETIADVCPFVDSKKFKDLVSTYNGLKFFVDSDSQKVIDSSINRLKDSCEDDQIEYAELTELFKALRDLQSLGLL